MFGAELLCFEGFFHGVTSNWRLADWRVTLKSIECLNKTKVKENKILPNRSSLVFQRGSWQWWDYFCWGITCTREDWGRPPNIPTSYDQSTVHISCHWTNYLKWLNNCIYALPISRFQGPWYLPKDSRYRPLNPESWGWWYHKFWWPLIIPALLEIALVLELRTNVC